MKNTKKTSSHKIPKTPVFLETPVLNIPTVISNEFGKNSEKSSLVPEVKRTSSVISNLSKYLFKLISSLFSLKTKDYQLNPSKSSFAGFTLVELIVVITILAILGTIAFVSFSSYSSNGRDSNRIANVSLIDKGIGISIAAGKSINTFDTLTGSNIVIVGSGGISFTGYYDNIGTKLLSSIGVFGDGLLNDSFQTYQYTYLPDNKFYQVSTTLENHIGENYIKGIIPINDIYFKGIIPINDIYFKGIIPINGMKYITGTNIDIIKRNNGTQYDLISNNLGLICPLGFIHIPGSENIDGQINGWCVAKYEMVPYDINLWVQEINFHGWIYTTMTDGNLHASPGNITSKFGTEPIINISKNEAQNACATNLVDNSGTVISNGKLITVNLWKKLVDDIINQGNNWTTGISGSGNISRGHSISNPVYLQKTGDNTFWLPQEKITGNYYFTREWYLSNGNTINDFAGNISEWFYDSHNGINGDYERKDYNDSLNITSIGQILDPDTNFEIGGISSLSSIDSGLGQIYNRGVSIGINYSSVFGGNILGSEYSGVFSVDLDTYSNSSSRENTIGFRCITPAK